MGARPPVAVPLPRRRLTDGVHVFFFHRGLVAPWRGPVILPRRAGAASRGLLRASRHAGGGHVPVTWAGGAAGWLAGTRRRRRSPALVLLRATAGGALGGRGDSNLIVSRRGPPGATGRIGVRGRRCRGQRDGSPRSLDGTDTRGVGLRTSSLSRFWWHGRGMAPGSPPSPSSLLPPVRTRLAAPTSSIHGGRGPYYPYG
uniref:Uncharacterized protein n=1 Tax=Setaria viridis TaxID=4556 RepID=A0A4U6VPM9_SETVI|nr:hypothetical protein SEVIR_2G123900v2 [Setaria viridis]